MPTYSTMRIPPPTDGSEFEDIVLSVLRSLWHSPSLAKHGRKGQAQQGTDLYGPDDLGRLVGVQCKATTELTLKTITAETLEAEKFQPPLTALHFATTLPTDAQLQKEVRIFSAERIKEGKFPIGILFWETIVVELAKNSDALRLHYPQFALPPESLDAPSGSRLLSALDISFLGSNLNYRLELIFGEFGWMAQEDPNGFSQITLQLDSCGQNLFSDPNRTEFSRLTNELLAGALRMTVGPQRPGETWQSIRALATRVEAFVGSLENRLPQAELAAYTCGRLLGRWDQLGADDKLSSALVEHLIESVTVLNLSPKVVESISKGAKDFEADETLGVMDISWQLYSMIRKELRSREMRASKSQ